MPKNRNRIMKSLFMYITLFTLVICIVGVIMSYFYKNIKTFNTDISITSDYNILNLYFLKTTKSNNITIKNYGLVDKDDLSSYYITFLKEDGTTSTFIKIGDIIYFNKIKLCENVDEFKIIVDKSEKESISIEVKILDKVYNSQYVLN